MSRREKRRYHRMALDLPARITVNAIDDYQGRLINISPGNMALSVDATVLPGDAVVVAISDLDIIEGRVARLFPGGFAVSFILSRKRRRVLTEKLMLRLNPHYADGLEDRRRTPRHEEGGRSLICRLPDGSSLLAKSINRSVDGIALDAPRRIAVGTPIHVGRQRGVVLRHTDRGFVVLFERMEEQSGQNEETASQPHLRAV